MKQTAPRARAHPLRTVTTASEQESAGVSPPPLFPAAQEALSTGEASYNRDHPRQLLTDQFSGRSTAETQSATPQPPPPPTSILNPHPVYTPRDLPAQQSGPTMAPGFGINHQQGNIFDASEDRCVLVHAVNCQGVWGMGIALQLKERLPKAFAVYQGQCKDADVGLIGTCLLIPPQAADYEVKDRLKVAFTPRHWVACLFTSKGYGRKSKVTGNPGKDPPAQILESTKTALVDMRRQLEAFGPSNFDEAEAWRTDDEKPGKLLAVRFNSGAFGVKWSLTKAVIEEVFIGFERPWYIVG